MVGASWVYWEWRGEYRILVGKSEGNGLRPAVKKLYQLRHTVTASIVSFASRS